MSKFRICIFIFFVSCFTTKTNQERTLHRNYSPEDLGFDSEILSKLIQMVKEDGLNVNSIVIHRNDSSVLDAHFYPQRAEFLHDVASVSKSISSLLTGIAIDKGYIKSVDQKIMDFFPNDQSFFNTKFKKAISVEHLLTMTSGICSTFGQGENMREQMKSIDAPLLEILASDLANPPGESFNYCSPGVQLLSMIIQESSNMTLESFAKIHLFEPLGIKEYRFATDLSGYSNASGDIFLSANDLVKIGRLILNEGNFAGQQIVSVKWIKQSTSAKSSPNADESYGYLWWLRNDLGGLIEAQGRGGQRLIILPEKQLVIVMYGTGFETGKIGEYIVKALKSDSAIEANEDGNQLLKTQLESIRGPFNVLSQKNIPDVAKEIRGKKYSFEENRLGLSYFVLNATQVDSANFILKVNNENNERDIPLGLNGNYVVSNKTRFNTPMASRAEWFNDHSILIDYNEFSNAHKYKITIEFADNLATFTIVDEADYGEPIELQARNK